MTVNNGFRIALAMLLLLASQAAMALGLGQIRLKSGLGEPLLAEIAVVSSVPGELERLHVGLASPETFARIGLDPPRGVIADLQFNLALSDDGQPVIRVTTTQPIDEPMLSFLVEVDWGQGRLVREYSALVDAPRTVAAPLAPPVAVPVAAPSSTIVRAPVDSTPAQDADGPATDAAPAGIDEAAVADEQASAQPSAPTAAAPAAPAAPAPAPTPAGPPGELRVQTGDTLSEIAGGIDLGVSLEQAMIALLRSNPGAFIDGNVHMLRAGALLRVPDQAAVEAVEAAEALAQVREQTRAWRQATAAVPQPAAVEGDEAVAAAAPAGPGAADQDSADDGAAAPDARLEIVPPGASDAAAAGNQSGISDGGEGDTMRQELQQANEVLAAREAELDELRSRLDELETIQADQQQLISLKDNELASVQAELAQAREQPGDGIEAGAAGWWIGGGVLLALVLLGGWLLQRRADRVPRFRAPTAAADPVPPMDSLAAAFPAAAGSAGREQAASEAVATPSATPPVTAAVPAPVPVQEGPGEERLDLARAYLDLGDRDSARQLLTELVVNGDLASRQQATRMLRELD